VVSQQFYYPSHQQPGESNMELNSFIPASDERVGCIEKESVAHYGEYMAHANRFGYINFYDDKPFVYEVRYYPNLDEKIFPSRKEVQPDLVEIVSLGVNGVEHFEQDKHGRVNIITQYSTGATETICLTKLATLKDNNEGVVHFKRSLPRRLRDYLASGLRVFRRTKSSV